MLSPSQDKAVTCLAIDTSLGACSVGLTNLDNPADDAFKQIMVKRGHAEVLPDLVAELLQHANIQTFDRIAVTRGPGSFTGLRVGLAFAIGLSLARQSTLIGLSSLRTLALDDQGQARSNCLVMINARHGNVFSQWFDDKQANISQWSRPAVRPVDDLTNLAKLDVGAPASVIINDASLLEVVPVLWRDQTEVIAAPSIVATARYALTQKAEDNPATPLYLRAPNISPGKQANFARQA